MQSIKTLFEKAWADAATKGYDHVVIAVDLHGTMVDSKVFNAAPGNIEMKVQSSIFRSAVTALKLLSEHPSVTMFIYSGTKRRKLEQVLEELMSRYGIEIDIDYSSDTQYSIQSFKNKPYFGILLDDKAGFDPDTDWDEITRILPNLNKL